MKKTINHKKYDTETAEKMGSCTNGKAGSFNFTRETLYRKRTGAFFLHGEGMWSKGEDIFPLTYDEAQRWAKESLSNIEYDAIFGEIDEDDVSKKIVTISLQTTTFEKAKRQIAKQEINLSSYIEELILKDIDEK